MIGKDIKAGVRIYFCRNAVKGTSFPAALSALKLRDDVILEQVPCSGKVDPRYFLKAFEAGAHTVCVLACPTGDCKLLQGNLRAIRRVELVRELLCEAGIDPNSVQMFQPETLEETDVAAATESITRRVRCESKVAVEVNA